MREEALPAIAPDVAAAIGESDTVADAGASVGLVYALSFVLAACSLLYELLIAQTLTMIAGNMVVWYSLTVGLYLAAMGIGAILYRPLGREADSWRQLFKVEIYLSAIGAGTVLLLYMGHSLYLYLAVNGIAREPGTAGFFALWFIVTCAVGVLTGIELPLLMHLGNVVAGGRDVMNRVLGWDYIGALGAGVVFPMALVPFFELHTIGFAIALLNLLVAAFLAFRFPAPGAPRAPRIALSAALGALLVWGLLSGPAITQYMLKRYYFYPQTTGQSPGTLFLAMPKMPPILRANSPYQKIDLVHYPATERFDELMNAWSTKFAEKPSAPRDRFLFLNGDPQFASNFEEVYHEWFAHVPIIAGGKVPKRVLVLGGGDGILHRELIKYQGIESITHVDIDSRLVELARTHPVLTGINEHALEDPRIQILFQDAYQYLRRYRGLAYDAIYMDFPLVQDYNLSRLYTREFYEYAKAHLADDGFMVMDAPLLLLIEDQDMEGRDRVWQAGSWDVHSNTIRQAGFNTVISYFTVLEPDNPRARAMLSGREDLMPAGVAASEERRREWIDRYLERFTRGLHQGFIMLRKDERRGPYSYVDFGIKTHVLNEARFGLAFPIPAKESREVDLGSVNSILRPTLPEGMVGEIRKAW